MDEIPPAARELTPSSPGQCRPCSFLLWTPWEALDLPLSYLPVCKSRYCCPACQKASIHAHSARCGYLLPPSLVSRPKPRICYTKQFICSLKRYIFLPPSRPNAPLIDRLVLRACSSSPQTDASTLSSLPLSSNQHDYPRWCHRLSRQ